MPQLNRFAVERDEGICWVQQRQIALAPMPQKLCLTAAKGRNSNA